MKDKIGMNLNSDFLNIFTKPTKYTYNKIIKCYVFLHFAMFNGCDKKVPYHHFDLQMQTHNKHIINAMKNHLGNICHPLVLAQVVSVHCTCGIERSLETVPKTCI